MTEDILLILEMEANAKGVEVGSWQHSMCVDARACILEKVKLAADTEEALSRALELIGKKDKQISVLKAALAENGKHNARQIKKQHKAQS
ncbi:MAG: hypothetical protein V3R25_10085 [Nitrosomonadaceae bacterium]